MDTVPERLALALAEHYRLERELGAGGMATVYAAEDLKHHRRVAIKVLRPDLAAAVGPERFQDEIEIAARLHHPHIVPVYDSGEAGGFLYYVMPLVEGQSLRERLQEGRPLPVNDVARILTEVADALAHAHEHGLVHRDIKPENIMLSGRHVMVMDFGIAKAIRDAGSRRSSTSIGLAMGTPEYMSPEQARGDADLDHRADIYSLGVVGYELLTGRPPFAGGGAESILTRHITMPPAPITEARPEVPPALVSVLQRALAKSPGERWQSAEAMRAQLEPLTSTTSGQVTATRVLGTAKRGNRWMLLGAGAAVLAGLVAWWAWGPSPSPKGATPSIAGAAPPVAADAIPDLAADPSVAVLPFQNMSSDKEQDYFSDGISEELLNLLAKVPKLRVIARTSSFQFKGKEIGIQEIGRQLHVAAVLEGSVRKSGDKVRITAQLVRASDGSHLWSETYDRTLDDVFKVQDEIAANVVEQLKLTLLGAAPKVRPVDPRAYPLILQAEALSDQRSTTSEARALSLFEEALKISPDESRAWGGMGRVYLNQGLAGARDSAEAARLARTALEKALAIDPNDALVTSRLAGVAGQLEVDTAAALALYERSLALGPSDPRVVGNTASMLTALGRPGEALPLDEWVSRVDPANPLSFGSLAGDYYYLRRWDDAIRNARTSLALSPDMVGQHAVIAGCLLLRGDALPEAEREARREPDEISRLAVLPQVLYAQGKTREADALMAQMEKTQGGRAASYIAAVYAWKGDADRAFAWLERARKQREAFLVAVPIDPMLDRLHKDPRWLPFLRSIGRAPEQLARYRLTVKSPEGGGVR